jgi:hypothetical protein
VSLIILFLPKVQELQKSYSWIKLSNFSIALHIYSLSLIFRSVNIYKDVNMCKIEEGFQFEGLLGLDHLIQGKHHCSIETTSSTTSTTCSPLITICSSLCHCLTPLSFIILSPFLNCKINEFKSSTKGPMLFIQ